ncbi:MAG: hypothetical protein H0U02_15280 [Rubrobacter sp.]|nr:hypothetical protein [Rubrobacter sp.]
MSERGELRRIHLPRTSVNKGKKKDGRVKIIANSSPVATNAGRNNPLALQGKEIAHQRLQCAVLRVALASSLS